jgi:hypothetical protein
MPKLAQPEATGILPLDCKILNSDAISLVANERAGSDANRIRVRSAKSVNEVRRIASKFEVPIRLYSLKLIF